MDGNNVCKIILLVTSDTARYQSAHPNFTKTYYQTFSHTYRAS